MYILVESTPALIIKITTLFARLWASLKLYSLDPRESQDTSIEGDTSGFAFNHEAFNFNVFCELLLNFEEFLTK